MFTSRAEYRTLLRQDNADLRLTERSYEIGLASQERMDKVRAKQEGVEKIKEIMKEYAVEPDEINMYLESIGSAPIAQKQRLSQLLLRPDVDLNNMLDTSSKLASVLNLYDVPTLKQAEVQVKYDTYISKEKELVQKMSQLEELIIPDSFNYEKLISLSNEARQKFIKIKPRTLGQASRISGVNPSDVQILMVYMGR
jgi:tRNA uridine 5-carboxymethylaminomethyl modification enzyme